MEKIMKNKMLEKMKNMLFHVATAINKKGYHTFNEILRSTLWMTRQCNATAIVLEAVPSRGRRGWRIKSAMTGRSIPLSYTGSAYRAFRMVSAVILAVGLMVGTTSCESFLDTENLTEKNTSNYPQTLVDAQQMVTGIYNNLSVVNANPQRSFYFISEIACDDRLGGGGELDQLMQAVDLMLSNETSMLNQFWTDRFAGIQRANTAIETLANCEGYESDDQKNQMIGEAYFLRAFYYYELASVFENIPLMVSSVPENNPQAAPDETWGQIIADLKEAIRLMPSRKAGWVESGHVDKWTAEALIARAFLFYTGFYGKSDVRLPDESVVSRSEIIGYIDDCVNNSGYELVPNFLNLWAYSNRLTKEDYVFTKGKNLKWVEDDNAVNPETLFAVKYSKFADWSTTIGYSNGYALFFGVRGGQDLATTFPFGQGWGAGPVAPNLWKDWEAADPTDIRRTASICDIRAELDPLGFTKGAASWADWVQETDYLNKKTLPITSKKGEDGGYTETFEQDMYDYTSANFQLTNIHDLVLIRFADVLLMQSELKQDPGGINRVRQRAGLQPVAGYSDEALRNERRWELAFEGVRWNDIRRWGIAAQALAAQEGQPVYFKGLPDRNSTNNNGGGYAARYNATKGFFPIPESQISLSGGLYKQNEGWGTNQSNYSSWR
jgi:hypothetical protein